MFLDSSFSIFPEKLKDPVQIIIFFSDHKLYHISWLRSFLYAFDRHRIFRTQRFTIDMYHTFGLFPGHTITVEKTPDLCKAAGNTLYKRGIYLMPTYWIGNWSWNAQFSLKKFSEKKVTKPWNRRWQLLSSDCPSKIWFCRNTFTPLWCWRF